MSMTLERPWIKGLTCFFLFLGVLWFSGGIGHFGVKFCNRYILPINAGRNIVINRAVYGQNPELYENYLECRISSDRLALIARGVLGWKGYLIPPYTFRDGMAVSGSISMVVQDNRFLTVPFYFVVDDDEKRPLISANLPVDVLNQVLIGTDILGKRLRKKEWILGHYNLINKKTFENLKFYSIPVPPDQCIDSREIVAEGAGWIRYTLDDNLLDARTTARVSSIVLRAILTVLYYSDGMGLDHDITIPQLKGNFNNIAPTFDRQLSEKLREAMELSLNKERNHQKIAKIRLPEWVPVDMDFLFEFN